MIVDPLSPDRIERASTLIDPRFLHSPQFRDADLSRFVGSDVVLKLETLNPIRSFKGRGADFLMRQPKRIEGEVVCASSGNFGQAIAYTGRAAGVPVRVYVADGTNPRKVARMRALGAEVIEAGADFDAAKDTARDYADHHEGSHFVEDGEEPAVSEGAGTIALELADTAFDTIAVPLGNGALITGIGCWLKATRPEVRVVGVCAEGASAMQLSWRAGEPVTTEKVATEAEGIAIRVPSPSAVQWLRSYVDDVVLVSDQEMLDTLALVRDTTGIMLETSAVAGLAAIWHRDLPGNRYATVLTGSNFSERLLGQIPRLTIAAAE